MLVVLMPESVLCIQIGDGDIVGVQPDGAALLPVPGGSESRRPQDHEPLPGDCARFVQTGDRRSFDLAGRSGVPRHRRVREFSGFRTMATGSER